MIIKILIFPDGNGYRRPIEKINVSGRNWEQCKKEIEKIMGEKANEIP